MVSHQNTLHSYFHSLHSPLSPTHPLPQHPHSTASDTMSTEPAPEREPKPRASSVYSVSTQGADEHGRKARKGSRAKHSWEYVAVDPAEDEAPPPNASRLEKELFSSFTNNFLAGQGRRTRAAALNASQHFHDHSGSESSHSHPASESAFSTTTTNTQASPASSPAPPSAPNASRKRKDSAAPTSDSTRKKSKTSTSAAPATSDPASSGATAAYATSAAATSHAASPEPHPAPAVQPAQSVHQDKSSALTSRAPDGQAKESAKRKSTVFDDATNKTKANKKLDSKPSPAPDSSENRKRKLSPPPEKMAPKLKKPKTGDTATTDNAAAAAKSAKAAAAQKRDSLLQEDVYAQALPWTSTATQNYAPTHSNSKALSKHAYRYAYPPTRAQLAEQLEEITHRGIAGGPANFPTLREYRAACAAEAAWQERDQEVVERMLDNPRVIEVLKRLRELNDEIEAERKGSSKGAGKGHGKGGRKRKVSSDDLMDGD